MIRQVNKYILYLVVTAFLILLFKPVFAYADNSTIISNPVIGDFDGDGSATSKDYALLKQHLLGHLDHFSVEARIIYRINDLDLSVTKGSQFVLPPNVSAVMLDNSKRDVPVVWNTTNVDTSKAGVITISGTVDGYNNKVLLTLTVQDSTSGNQEQDAAVADANSAIAIIPVNITSSNLSDAKALVSDAESKIVSALTLGAGNADFIGLNNISTAKGNIRNVENSQSSSFSVTSVEALNKAQLKVIFNQKVDKVSAENVMNYSLNNIAFDFATTCTLQNDGQTLIITASNLGGGFNINTLKTSVGYILKVNGVQNFDKSKMISGFSSAPFNFSDDISPTITSISSIASKTTNRVVVKFSEPVKGIGLYLINGTPVTSITTDYSSNSVTLTSASILSGGSDYTLNVINEQDLSGNFIAQNPSSLPFNLTILNTPPTVNVSTDGENIDLIFSRGMDSTTLIGLASIKVLNSNGMDITTLGASVSIVHDLDNFDGTLFHLKLGAVSQLFDSATKSLSLSLVFTSNIRDNLGNSMTATTVPITLILDQAAPVITSAKWVAAGGMYDSNFYSFGALILTFSEKVVPAFTLVSGSNFTAITDKGIVDNEINSFTFARCKSNDSRTMIYIPQPGSFAGTNTETLRFNSGVFTDTSFNANTSTIQVVILDLVNTVNEMPPDTTAPVLGMITSTANNISVDLGETINTLNASTVLNVSNYLLNGSAMPAGTYVTVSSGLGISDKAIIHLPANSILSTGNYAVTVSGIKDAAGNVCDTGVGVVFLMDNKSPIMNSLSFNLDGSLTVGFDESVMGFVPADLIIKVDNVVVDQNKYTIMPGIGADYGKAIVTFIDPVNSGSTVEVTTASSSAAKDNAGNPIVSGTNLSVQAVSTTPVTGDNQPEMNSLLFNPDGSLSIGFEDSVMGFAATDFIIKVNGMLMPAYQYTVVSGNGEDFGKAVIRFLYPLYSGSTIEITTASSSAAKDVAGNSIIGGTCLSITK